MALFEVEVLNIKTAKNDAILNLRNVKIKKEGKEIPMSVSIDGPFRIIEKSRYEKNKTVYPFNNWKTIMLNHHV